MAAPCYDAERISGASVRMTLDEIVTGARYKEGGRGWPNVDCYGICLEYRRSIGLHDLPELGNARRLINMDNIGRSQAGKMNRCKPEQGAIAACFDGAGLMTHVAVMIDEHNALECNNRRNASVTRLSALKRRFKTVEFYK